MTSLEPLADQGLLARFADEEQALRWAAAVRRLGADWVLDVVGAYTTVAVFLDLDRVTWGEARAALEGPELEVADAGPVGQLRSIPCCYELGLDLDRIAGHTGLSREEIIRLHTSVEYTVYAIGFCPGFPYLGYLPSQLCGVPRLESPRLRLEAGSVGLTGGQTGIYTEPRPGGWNIVGRTPLVLVDVEAGYFPLRTGDRVRFVRIDEAEHRGMLGQRL